MVNIQLLPLSHSSPWIVLSNFRFVPVPFGYLQGHCSLSPKKTSFPLQSTLYVCINSDPSTVKFWVFLLNPHIPEKLRRQSRHLKKAKYHANLMWPTITLCHTDSKLWSNIFSTAICEIGVLIVKMVKKRFLWRVPFSRWLHVSQWARKKLACYHIPKIFTNTKITFIISHMQQTLVAECCPQSLTVICI